MGGLANDDTLSPGGSRIKGGGPPKKNIGVSCSNCPREEIEMEEPIKRCPFCKEETLEDAVKCKHCHEWLDGRRVQPPVTIIEKPEYSNAQNPKRLMLLCILSFSIYWFYWYYRTWKFVKEYRKLDINPVLRTIGAIIPIVSIFFNYRLFSEIQQIGKELKTKTYRSPEELTVNYAILGFIRWCLFILYNFVFLNLFSFDILEFAGNIPYQLIPLIYFINKIAGIGIPIIGLYIIRNVQRSLNNIWEDKKPDLLIRKHFSDGEIIVMVVGIVLWVSYFIITVLALVQMTM